MSGDMGTTLHRLFGPGSNTMFALEPLFWIVLAGALCGLAIQLVIVVGMIATMAGAAIPHHARRYHHRFRHQMSVWFGGRSGAHVRPVMG